MSRLRARIKSLPVLGLALEAVWRTLTGRRDLTFTLLQNRTLPADACVIKIGSNDGSAGDPIAQLLVRRPAMRCIFVEPVAHLLTRARRHWGETPRFTYVLAAINDGRRATFYYLDPSAREQLPDLPVDPDQLGSFNRQHILKHPGGNRLAAYIRTLDIEGMTLDALFQYAQVTTLDILHIDTEGWDWKILSQLDLDRWQPAYILFEHIHLDETEKVAARARLAIDYDLDVYGTDWLCTRKLHPTSAA